MSEQAPMGVYPPMGSEDCQASHCPPPGQRECVWPDCALQLDREGHGDE